MKKVARRTPPPEDPEVPDEDYTNLPTPPDSLGDVGTEYWTIICTQLASRGRLSPDYLIAVEQVCILYDEIEEMNRDIQHYGTLLVDATGSMKSNPLIALRLTSRKTISNYLQQLGLTHRGNKLLENHNDRGNSGPAPVVPTRSGVEFDDEDLFDLIED